MHSMPPAKNIPRPLGEIVRDVLARGDDRAWNMPQESTGAWSEERLAGWRTDPDITAQLAALKSLDLSREWLGNCTYRKMLRRPGTSPIELWRNSSKFFSSGGNKVRRMLGVCMHMYSIFIPLSVLTHAQCVAELPVCV